MGVTLPQSGRGDEPRTAADCLVLSPRARVADERPARAHSAHDGHSLRARSLAREQTPCRTIADEADAALRRSIPLRPTAGSCPLRSHADVLICPVQESQPKSPKAAAPILLLQAASLGTKALQGGCQMSAAQLRPAASGVVSELAFARAQRNTVLIVDDLFSSR